jgi:hypothetical protein
MIEDLNRLQYDTDSGGIDLVKKFRCGEEIMNQPGWLSFRGTGEFAIDDNRVLPTVRKLYVSIQVDDLKKFIEAFYGILDAEGISIFGSKAYFGSGLKDENGDLIFMSDNHFVIHLCGDEVVPKVVNVIEKAAKISGAKLRTYDKKDLRKTIAIHNKIIVGIDTESKPGGFYGGTGESFDNWTFDMAEEIMLSTREAGKADLETVKNLMCKFLAKIGKTPTQYLSSLAKK